MPCWSRDFVWPRDQITVLRRDLGRPASGGGGYTGGGVAGGEHSVVVFSRAGPVLVLVSFVPPDSRPNSAATTATTGLPSARRA
jgi:hypothetical protein